MDYDNIPLCAMIRETGTVLIRNISFCNCCRTKKYPLQDSSVVLRGYSRCEISSQGFRNNRKICDCEKLKVEAHRPYRISRETHSRYTSVYAFAYLLLLVGSLSPPISATPHGSRKMDRQRRAVDSGENALWGNPCDYNDSDSKSAVSYSPKLAKQVASQARSALTCSTEYKDKFAMKLHSYPKFEDLVKEWDGYDWVRKLPWYRDELLPKEKILNQPMPEEYMNNLMGTIDEVLPSMYKVLKMIVAGLNAITREGLNENIISDENLKDNIVQTMHNVRGVLCLFNTVMISRNLEIMPLLDSEISDFKTEDKLCIALLVYRDTLNYLEYLAQVFQKLHDMNPDQA